MSLILNLQHWKGDKEQAMALATLVADLEESPREDVIFLFTHRYDSPLDEAVFEYVKKKFPRTHSYRTQRMGTGWPEGPNQMYACSHNHCIDKVRAGDWKDVDGILFMEADCVPLAKDWINRLKAEWEEAKAAGKMALGCWLEKGDCGVRHINGNCIFHVNLWEKSPGVLHPKGGGWDADLAEFILPYGYPSKLIYSDYGLGKPDYNPWKGCEDMWKTRHFRDSANALFGQDLHPVWLHGPKVMEAIQCVRQKFNVNLDYKKLIPENKGFYHSPYDRSGVC